MPARMRRSCEGSACRRRSRKRPCGGWGGCGRPLLQARRASIPPPSPIPRPVASWAARCRPTGRLAPAPLGGFPLVPVEEAGRLSRLPLPLLPLFPLEEVRLGGLPLLPLFPLHALLAVPPSLTRFPNPSPFATARCPTYRNARMSTAPSFPWSRQARRTAPARVVRSPSTRRPRSTARPRRRPRRWPGGSRGSG